MSMLGEALAGQGKYEEAAPLLLEGWQGLQARAAGMTPADRERVTEAVQRLVEVARARGEAAAAAKWEGELTRWNELHKKRRAEKK
jgi:hypothetical protein